MKSTFLTVLLFSVVVFASSCKEDKKEQEENNPTDDGTTFKDSRDDQSYPLVTIGTQTWFAANLNYAKTGAVCYDNNSDSCVKYGKLYDSLAAQTACPSGSHLPSDAEWKTLEMYLGMSETDVELTSYRGSISGKLLKDSSSGFNALYSGLYNVSVGFSGTGTSTGFWSSTISDNQNKYYVRALRTSSPGQISRNNVAPYGNKYCVRCLKD